jgi:hypothetical protein
VSFTGNLGNYDGTVILDHGPGLPPPFGHRS